MASSSRDNGYMTGAGHYQQGGQMNFGSQLQSHDAAYYPTQKVPEDWFSPSGDPAAFVGTESAEYYYVSDEQENEPSMLAPSRR